MQNLMPPINTPDNLFHDGNPLIGTQGTIVTAEHLNHVQGAVRDLQRELLNILLDAGIDIDPNDDSQVLDALKAIIGRDYSGKFLTKLNNLKEILDAGVNAQASARKNLGLGAAATYDVQASPADATPGKLVPIGGFGLGAENTPVANINADAMRVSGFYGGPGIGGVNYYDPYAALLVMSRYNTDGGMMQISANGKVAVRGRGFDKLSNWNELFGKL
ncbi:hypothetical protein, partial [Hafnia paralvei]|uniref:hypothetical protein n=1 Tax=Hafnia paralvei TaxID=546367 RepID=UPI00210D8A9D